MGENMDLQKFCSTDSFRININKPFSKGDYTYATNGHIMVRVSKVEGIGEQETSDTIKAVNPVPLFSDIENLVYVPIPDIPPTTYEQCQRCEGAGKLKTCPECDGDGFVCFTNRYSDYECDCETCGGTGKLAGDQETCGKCIGTGKIAKREFTIVGGQKYDNKYLSMIKELPDCEIAETGGLKAAHFKFTGGDGLLMPVEI